jgi:hypothetical protein
MPYEIRWFCNDNLDEVKDWWSSIDLPYNDEGERSDYYIFIPNVDFMGIKNREGRLEVKWRIPNSQKRLETTKFDGILEEWVKWSWSDSKPLVNDPAFNFLSEYPKGPMIKISKRRLSRKFKLLSGDKFEPVEWIDLSESGFSMELTEIILEKSKWWSIGFETLGNKITPELFQIKIEEISNKIPLKLELENSFGYPRWILNTFKYSR